MRKLDKKLSKKLQKSLSDVICRIKSQSPKLRIGSTTSRLINGCRHPHSLPLYVNGRRLRRRKSTHSDDSESETAASESAINKTEATLEDIDRFLFENFRSLYSGKFESDREAAAAAAAEDYDSSDRSFETPDLTTPSELYRSRRFFVSPASSVNDEVRTSLARSDDGGGVAVSTITASSAARSGCLKPDLVKGLFEKGIAGGGGKEKSSLPSEDCIAVLKATGDPIEDFRRSMRQVMEARARHGQVVDWGFMEEMLFCYLRLNEKKYYRFVLDAFVDSVVDMRRNSCDGGVGGGAAEEEVARKETGKKKGKEREN